MMRDAAVFYSRLDDPVAWQKVLQAELPDLGFHVHPDMGDPQTVRYALTWKPPAGFFAAFPNLALVVNLGAGVDSLVARDDLPDVPIARLSDGGMVSLMSSYVLFSVIRYAREIPAFERARSGGTNGNMSIRARSPRSRSAFWGLENWARLPRRRWHRSDLTSPAGRARRRRYRACIAWPGVRPSTRFLAETRSLSSCCR
jgi:hypothetical protein